MLVRVIVLVGGELLRAELFGLRNFARSAVDLDGVDRTSAAGGQCRTRDHDDGSETGACFHASWDAIKREKMPSTPASPTPPARNASNAPEDPDDHAEEHSWFEIAGPHQNRGHLGVRGLKADVVSLGVVIFHG